MAQGDDGTTGDGTAEVAGPIEGDSSRASIEFAKATADCAYFIHEFLTIEDAQGHGDGSGTMPFKLWPAQVGIVWSLMTERLVIVLKARQLGISWLCCAYALWHCIYQPNKTALLYSQGQDEANELLRRVKVLFERLPDWFKDACPEILQDNTTSVVFSNGSRIKSLPATQKAGRSLTASLVVLDEAAFLQWGDALYTALKPTIDGGGQLVVLSTANGIGNLFHNLWTRAVSGLNSFKTIFLPWWARPGRDQAWYDAKIAEETNPKKVLQEYPSSPTESFLVSGRTRFESSWLQNQAIHVRDGLPRASLPAPFRPLPDSLNVYSPPWHPPLALGRKCIVAADVAEGLEHGDYSDAVVIDAESWEELANLHGHWEPDEFAKYLQVLGDAYDAPIAVERNNHGHAVLATLKGIGSRRVGLGLDGRPGWHTNAQTKPMAIDLLATALRDGLIKVRSQAAINEMMNYRILPNGSTGAPDSYFDDRVMSRAIALIFARSHAPRKFRAF